MITANLINKYQPYSEYKDSGVEWLGDVPNNWTVGSFRHAVDDIKNGSTETQVDEAENTVPISRIESISKGEIDFGRVGYIQKKPSLCQFKLNIGDILLSHINSLSMMGNVAQLTTNTTLYHGMNLLRLKPSAKMNKRFLLWWLKSDLSRKTIESLAKPAINQASIGIDQIKSMACLYPDIKTQRTIAAFLDDETARIDQLIAKQQQLIELLKEKRQAVISHAVTKGLNPNAPMKDSGVEWLGQVPEHWVLSKLNYQVSTRKGVAFKAEDFCDEGIPVVKASDIKELTIRSSSTCLPSGFAISHPKAVLNEFDIILSTVGSTPDVKNSAVGQLGIVPFTLEGSLLNQNTVVFNANSSELINEYLFFLLQTRGYRDHLDLHAHGTANQASLNITDMLDFNVAFPSVREQIEIITSLKLKLTEMSKLENKCSLFQTILQERRTALISAAVTGKIDLRGWQPPKREVAA